MIKRVVRKDVLGGKITYFHYSVSGQDDYQMRVSEAAIVVNRAVFTDMRDLDSMIEALKLARAHYLEVHKPDNS